MSLTRKHFIELAKAIGRTNDYNDLVDEIKSFCKRHNGAFKQDKFDIAVDKVRKQSYGNLSHWIYLCYFNCSNFFIFL